MKVISGSLKGRNILGYDILGTRPTMDRVKESIFGMIQNHLRDSVVLDLFAGSGNYGIEAISNGASKVYFNDHNKKCIKVITDNLKNFNVFDKSELSNLDYWVVLEEYVKKGIKFDLVFIDPPYKEHVIGKILKFLASNNLINNNGLVICELTEEVLEDSYDDLILFKERKYGEKKVFIYKKDCV